MTQVYNSGVQDIAAGTINVVSDDVRVLLVVPGYTFSAAHAFVADVVASELSGAGYVRKVLASKTLIARVFDAADVTWTALGPSGTSGFAILFKFVTNDADSRLIGCFDLAPQLPTNGSNYIVTWNAAGIIAFSSPNT